MQLRACGVITVSIACLAHGSGCNHSNQAEVAQARADAEAARAEAQAAKAELAQVQAEVESARAGTNAATAKSPGVAGAGLASALAADADTTLLAHFDGDASTKPGQAATSTRELSYEAGVVGSGVAIGSGSVLSYPVAGVLDPQAGTVEFWIQPKWNGNTGTPHVFFQAGQQFDNCLLMQIDGANNVRFMTWGDDPATAAVEKDVESGVGFSGAAWKAGEWHHRVATWTDSGRRLALHVDGRLADSSDKGIVLGPPSTTDFSLGTAIDGSSTADAIFDELRISKIGRGADVPSADSSQPARAAKTKKKATKKARKEGAS
jgi:hypothetical protein